MPENARPLLSPDSHTPAVAQSIARFHADTVSEVREAVAREAVVVVGMSLNPFVRKVREALSAAGVQFRYIEYGGYLGQWKRRLAIKMWSGWPTFPQVFVSGVLIGGFDETKAALTDGSLRRMLDARASS